MAQKGCCARRTGPKPASCAIRLRARCTTDCSPGPPDGSQFYFHKYAEAYPNEMNHFVESLEEGRQPMVSVEDGYRSQLLVEAAVESLKSNRPVQVAE